MLADTGHKQSEKEIMHKLLHLLEITVLVSVTPQGGDGSLTIIWNLNLAVKEGVIYK